MIAIRNENFRADLPETFYKLRGSSMSEVTAVAAPIDFLDEGYTASVDIPAEEGRHGALSVDFKPCVSSQIAKVLDAATKSEEDWTNAVIPICAAQIAGWTLKDRHGSAVPISPASLGRVSRPLLLKIAAAVVFGEKPNGEKSDVGGDVKN